MPRLKRPPLPDMTAHNYRKRAEQMEVIAGAMQGAARAALHRKAQELRQMALKEIGAPGPLAPSRGPRLAAADGVTRA